MSAAEFRIEPLGPAHNREGFTCSAKALEHYLRNHAAQDVKKKVAAVFVLTPDGNTVAGYYALSQFSVRLGDLPADRVRRLPKYPNIPATLLGRLAVSDNYRRQGLGEKLLVDALRRCADHSGEIGSFAVIVDAKDDDAKNFYQKYGFIELPGIQNRLFLPMKTIEQMFQ